MRHTTLKHILSLSLVAFSGAWLAYRMKLSYLRVFSESLITDYPSQYWLEAITVGALLSLVLFLSEKVIFTFVVKEEEILNACFINSLSYLCAFIFPFPLRLNQVFLLFLVSKLAILILYRSYFFEKIRAMKIHLVALLAISIGQAVFIPFVSPQTWENPISAINKDESVFIGPASTSQWIQYSNAKKFDFLGFDHAAWGSIPFSVNAGRSYLTPWLVNLFNLPVIDSESQVRSSLIVALVWMIIGSFAFYLYLHLALRLSYFSSLMGGLLFTVANPFLAEQFTSHFPMFYGPYLTLPLALLFSRIAFSKRSWVQGLLSGVLFSFHFYGFQNHPDTVIHAYLIWTLYIVFLFCFNSEASKSERFKIFIASQFGFFLVGQYPLSPSFDNLLKHEMAVIGHRQGIYVFYGAELGKKIVIEPVLWLCVVLPLIIPSLIKTLRTKRYPQDFIFYAALIFMFLFCFLLGNDSPFFLVLSKLNVQVLNFRQTSRILMYFSLSILVVLMYGVDWYLQSHSKSKKTDLLAAIIMVSLLCFYWVKKFEFYKGFIVGSVCLLLVLVFYTVKYCKTSMKNAALVAALFFILLQYGSLNWLGEQKAENPSKCKYYTSLGSLLIKAPLFLEDIEQSKAVILNRLHKFKQDWSEAVQNNSGFDRNKYPAVTTFISDKNTNDVTLTEAIPLAERLYPEIDRFYFEDNSCVHPLNKKEALSGGQGKDVNFNLMGIFKGFENRFEIILNRSVDLGLLGVGQGYQLQNSASVIPEFFKHYPPINALYLIPGEYFLKTGGFRLIPRATQEGSEIFSDIKTRKIYNLGGIQLFLVKEKDVSELKKISGLEIIKPSYAVPYNVPYVFVHDHLSYDNAYFAQKIEFVSPELNRFDSYRHPLRTESIISQYKNDVDLLHDKLLSLNGRHAILLEDKEKKGSWVSEDANNTVKTVNVLGGAAAFQVSCKKEPCQFVYNMASLEGWKAFISGMQVPIQRANFAFLSVSVPLGEHLLWFEYHPLVMTISIFIAVVTLLFLASLLIREVSKLKK